MREGGSGRSERRRRTGTSTRDARAGDGRPVSALGVLVARERAVVVVFVLGRAVKRIGLVRAVAGAGFADVRAGARARVESVLGRREGVASVGIVVLGAQRVGRVVGGRQVRAWRETEGSKGSASGSSALIKNEDDAPVPVVGLTALAMLPPGWPWLYDSWSRPGADALRPCDWSAVRAPPKCAPEPVLGFRAFLVDESGLPPCVSSWRELRGLLECSEGGRCEPARARGGWSSATDRATETRRNECRRTGAGGGVDGLGHVGDGSLVRAGVVVGQGDVGVWGRPEEGGKGGGKEGGREGGKEGGKEVRKEGRREDSTVSRGDPGGQQRGGRRTRRRLVGGLAGGEQVEHDVA